MMSGRQRLLAARIGWATACTVALALALALSAVAGALQGDVRPLSVNRVDDRGRNPVLEVTSTATGAPDALRVEVNGSPVSPVTVEPLATTAPPAVGVVIDNSAAVGNGPVQIAKDQLPTFAPSERIDAATVVTAGGRVQVPVPGTHSADVYSAGIGDVAGGSGGALLWDAASRALSELRRAGADQPNLLLVAASPDAGSSITFSQLEAELAQAGAAVHVIALGSGADLDLLQRLVAARGGSFQTGTSGELAAMSSTVSGLIAGQYRVSLPPLSSGAGELASLRLQWGSAQTGATFVTGTDTRGWDALTPVVDDSGFLDRLLSSSAAKWLLVLLATAAVGMGVYAVAALMMRKRDGIDFALRHYDGYAVEADGVLDDEGNSSALGKLTFLRKAVAVTGRVAERRGFLQQVEELLERADLPLRPAEAIFFYVAIVSMALIGSLVLLGNVLIAAAVALLAVVVPRFVVSFKAKRRAKRFVEQLPDMLQLLSGTLRAGYSVSQGFDAVSREIGDPMGRELRRVMTESRLGRPLEEALQAAAERMKSADFEWAVMAIRIQREVGGNLAELLMTVADTMTQRERLRRDVQALTAEGRMSAIVLGMLPPGLAVLMYVMNPTYIGRLFDNGLGIAMLVAGVVMMLVGFAWMKKVITIEV